MLLRPKIYRVQHKNTEKIVGKSVLRFVPLIGWAWMFTESIFIKRDWDKDKLTIPRDLGYLTEYPTDYSVTVRKKLISFMLRRVVGGTV